jgi:hypothetical protein
MAKRKTSNWMVKITRLNTDGSRDYINMIECTRIESAKRTAASYSRESGIYATIIDVFNHAGVVYQYMNGHMVAKVAQ